MKNKFIIIIIFIIFILSSQKAQGISPAAASPSPTSTASPSVALTPTTADDEKVKEIRDAIKEKVNAIKEKIEKRAYVGIISQITDSTFTLENFRGKQRVRITEQTTIIGSNKKEIKTNELAVGDKVIALGTLSDNEILEAKRVVVVPIPKTVPAKRLIFFGKITETNVQKGTLIVTDLKNLDQTLELKVDKTTTFIFQSDPKVKTTLKDLKENQKVVIIYPETAQGNPIVKSLFILP